MREIGTIKVQSSWVRAVRRWRCQSGSGYVGFRNWATRAGCAELRGLRRENPPAAPGRIENLKGLLDAELRDPGIDYLSATLAQRCRGTAAGGPLILPPRSRRLSFPTCVESPIADRVPLGPSSHEVPALSRKGALLPSPLYAHTVERVVDNLTPPVRSRIMASVGQKNTEPEMVVRRLLHRLGYRYALHRRDLPGRPDLVFGPRRKVVFVHGCFWHGHHCHKGRLPASRVEYWSEKIENNRARDATNVSDLQAGGWEVRVIWECETAAPNSLRRRLIRFLNTDPS